MKKIKFLFFYICLLFCLKANSQFITFEKTLGSGQGLDVVQTYDNGYAITGITPGGVLLYKVDEYGDSLWKNVYDLGSGEIGQSIYQNKDSGYILLGSIFIVGILYEMLAIRVNANGDTLWTKTFGNSIGSDHAYSVQQTLEGGFIFCGSTSSYPNVVKIDSSGDTLWTRYIPVNGLFSIKQTYDSGYVVAGWAGIFLDPYYIAKLDTAGNIQWYKTFYDSNFSSFMDVIQMPDSGFIASGEGNRLYRVNAQGDSVWSSLPGEGGYVIDNTSDGGYIVAGTTPGVRLTKWDANNNLQWVKSHYPVPNYYCRTKSIQQTSDGGYVVCGYGDSAGVQKVYLLKTDSLGNVYTGINENEVEKTQGMVYPNPINEVGYLLLVNQNYAALKNSSFILYDVTGKILREENSIKFPFKIERKDLISGMYFYRVADEKGLMVSGKIIMQ